MIASIAFLLLGAGAASAQQTPLGESTCLSPSVESTQQDFSNCCPSPNSKGEKNIAGVSMEYSCGNWVSGTQIGPYHDVPNAYACAKLCAESDICGASFLTTVNWTPQCYLYEKGYGTHISSAPWFVFTKKAGTPPIVDPVRPDFVDSQCPRDHGVTYKAGQQSYKVFCAQWPKDYGYDAQSSLTAKQCLETCTKRGSTCRGIMYWSGSRPFCYFLPTVSEAELRSHLPNGDRIESDYRTIIKVN